MRSTRWRAGLARGTRAGVLAAFACTLGTVPHALAALTGLAAVLHASGVAFQAIKYAGVAYLLWMAWSTWRDTGALHVDTDASPSSVRAVITTGITANLLNPKLTLFFFAFLPQFVPAGSSGTLARMVGLSAVFMAMTFVTFAAYAVAAGALRDRVLTRPQLVTRIRKVVRRVVRRAERAARGRVAVGGERRSAAPGVGRHVARSAVAEDIALTAGAVLTGRHRPGGATAAPPRQRDQHDDDDDDDQHDPRHGDLQGCPRVRRVSVDLQRRARGWSAASRAR